MHLSSSYAKILGEKLFRTWEIPRSGSKAKDGEREKERKKERGEKDGTMVIAMAKLCMAHASTHGARKPSGPQERREKERKLVIAMAKLCMAHAWCTQAAWANYPVCGVIFNKRSCASVQCAPHRRHETDILGLQSN